MRYGRPLSDLLNQFGICECCKQQTATKNESVWCENCYAHFEYCNQKIEDAYAVMELVVNNLISKYKNDPLFWNILLGK